MPPLFKYTYLSNQWPFQREELRKVIGELVLFLEENSLAPLVITEMVRRHSDNVAIYLKQYLSEGKPKQEAESLAHRRFTYHFTRGAADFRGGGKAPWTKQECAQILTWLRKRCPAEEWEVLQHDAGTGLHFHVALRDKQAKDSWRAPPRGVA